jgi:CRP-like cAMP-binding protein
VVATVGPGEGFGEIALLRRTPRTATVVARSPLKLRALASDRFTSVVLGFTPSARAAAADVADLLGRYSPGDSAGEPSAE